MLIRTPLLLSLHDAHGRFDLIRRVPMMPSLFGLGLALLLGLGLVPVGPAVTGQRITLSAAQASHATNAVTTTVGFVRSITTHTDTYSVTTDGTTQPENLYLRIENVGTTNIVRPKIVVNGRPDWSTMDAILAEIIEPGMTDDEKARAIWQFARQARYHWWPPTVRPDIHDPVKLFGTYGYGFCDDVASAMAAMFDRVGLLSRIWNIGQGEHTVSEAYYNGDWHLLDADRDGLYLERDNRTVASVQDVLNEPYLIERAPSSVDLSSMYARTPKDSWFWGEYGYETGHEISLTLRPREALILTWQGNGLYHNDTSWQDVGSPPEYANGQILSQFIPADSAYRQWIFEEVNVRSYADDSLQPLLSPLSANVPGELVYKVSSPYPIVGVSLTANLYRENPTDTLEIQVSRYDNQVDLPWFDLATEKHRLPGIYVTESNLQGHFADGNWPALHTTIIGQPAYLIYQVSPLHKPGTRVQIGGKFYREGETDVSGISISFDAVNWQTIWQADQTGFVDHLEDVTDLVDDLDSFYIRYEFVPNSSFDAAGLQEIKILGIGPFAYQLDWSSAETDLVGDLAVSVDVSSVMSSTFPAPYHYFVRFVMQSPTSPLSVGLNGFTLTTTVQIAPRSLPALALGVNQVEYSDLSEGPVSVQVTHGWMEIDGPHAPRAPSMPVSPTEGTSIPAPFSLQWQPSSDPDGDAIVRYHAMLCDRPDCRWPLSSVFDVDLQDTNPSWIIDYPYYTWLNAGQTYYWRVKAQDATGLWSEYSPIWAFVVSEIPITTLGAVTDGPTSLGEATTLTATIEAGSNVSYTWDFGNGTLSSGTVVSHAYPAVGFYSIVLTATNPLDVLTTTATVQVEESFVIWLPLIAKN